MKELVQNLLKLQDLEFADACDSKAEAAIAGLRKKIPTPILEHYERLTDQGKRGVATVRHQVCAGCHMRIPIGAVISLMHDDDLQICGNCGRYLYLPVEARTELLEAFEETKTAAAARSRLKRNAELRAL